MTAASTIDTTFVVNSSRAPKAISYDPACRVMPTTESGGTSATAMATPDSELDTRGSTVA